MNNENMNDVEDVKKISDPWKKFLDRFPVLKYNRRQWITPENSETVEGIKHTKRQIRKFLLLAMKRHPERIEGLKKPTRRELYRYDKAKNTMLGRLYHRVIRGMLYGADIYSKPAILRALGADIGDHVFIAKNVVIDTYFPERIHLDDDVILGMGATIVTHEIDEEGNLLVGDVYIGKQTAVSGAVVLPSVKIGKNCAVGWACVNKNVGDDKLLTSGLDAQWQADLGVFPSLGHYTIMEKNTKKMLKDFSGFYKKEALGQKDQTFEYDLFYNLLSKGKHWAVRLGEFGCLMLQQNPLLAPIRNDLLRLAGAKIGKNVKIGDNVIAGLIDPSNLTIEDDVIVGDGCLLSDHRILHFPSSNDPMLRLVDGAVNIRRGAIVDQGTWVMCSIDVKEGAYVPPCQMTIRDIEAWNEKIEVNEKRPLMRAIRASTDLGIDAILGIMTELLLNPVGFASTILKYRINQHGYRDWNDLDDILYQTWKFTERIFGSVIGSTDKMLLTSGFRREKIPHGTKIPIS